jgi:two-component system, cell cycle sensor histidine kinase and response regulator CckA
MPRLILLVDDDPLVQGEARRMLQLAGYTCLTADTAIDALTYLKNGPVPDLVILDIRLQDLPGIKLALRIHAQYPQIPILFVSGWAGEAVNPHELVGLRWGSLQKPYTPETLLPAVERLLLRTQP